MRLSPQEREAIKRAVALVAGDNARVRLFGSRLRDDLRGGDIDVLVEFDEPVAEPAWLAARVEAAIVRAIGERKVDVVVDAPNVVDAAVRRQARLAGEPL